MLNLMTKNRFHVLVLALGGTSLVIRWIFRHELAGLMLESWNPSTGLWRHPWPPFGILHLLSPVFILGCCLASMIGLLRTSDSEATAAKALRDTILAGGIAVVMWVAALVLLGQSANRSHMLHGYFWYPIYGLAAFFGAILTRAIRPTDRLGSKVSCQSSGTEL